MELRQLEHFIAVAEEQHFTRAAELMQISQSGLSASIRSLESELGTPLFVRSTRRVELTQAGRAFFDEAVRTVSSAAAAKSAVDAIQGVLRGTLSVGTEQCLGVIDLPAELARFRGAHPGVEIRMGFDGSANLVERVASGRLDLALVAVCDPHAPGVRLVPVSTEGFVVLCHPDHPLAKASSVGLNRLAEEEFVGFLPEWAARVLAEQAFAAAGLIHRVTMEVNDVGTLLDLVGHDLGIAIVPEHFGRKRPGRLRAIEVKDCPISWSVAIAVPDQASPAARTLLAQLVEESASAVA